MIDVFLVHDDPGVAAILRNCIAANPEFSLVSETQSARDGLFAVATISSGRPRMLVQRIALPDMNGFEVIQQVQQRNRDVYVVPVLEGNEAFTTMQALMQLRLNDVLSATNNSGEISRILQSAAKASQQLFDQYVTSQGGPQGEAFVITVMAARSGVGKSVLATNLAAAMAKMSNSVALMDFSLNPGDFAIMLDMVPPNTIEQAIGSGNAPDTDLLQNLLTQHEMGFRFLASPNQEFDAKMFDYNIGAAMMQAIRGCAEYVIVDTGVAMSEPTIAAADNSDIIFLVTSRDVTRLSATQRMLKFLKEREIAPNKVKVIVNEAEVGEEISMSDIEQLLEHPVCAYLPCNAAPVTFSINKGQPIVLADPGQPVAMMLQRLAEISFNKWQDKTPDAKKKTAGKTTSQRLFSR
jgi:pilus assembly protein CpaE